MLVEADFSHNSLRDDDVVQILGVLVCFRTIGIVSFDDNLCGSCADVIKSNAWTSFNLTIPMDETISLGWNGVVKFLKQNEFIRVHKTRLMFIGRGVSGKTRLVRALLHGNAASIDVQTGRTVGIDLSNPLLLLPGKRNEPVVEAQLWDFAGQELSYLSHSVHLSARCVYVLVWSPRKEMDESSRDSVEGILRPMVEWLQILSSHVPDANVVLVGTHSMTPEDKDRPSWFNDAVYVAEYANIAIEVQRKVVEEINRLNFIVEQELVHLQQRVFPLLNARLAAAIELWQELLVAVSVAPSSASVSSQPSISSLQPSLSTLSQQSHLPDRNILLQLHADASAPHDLCKCAEEVLNLQRLQTATQERMRRLCGIRDGSAPRANDAPVKMRLILASQVDSSNQSGIPELKQQLSFCCHGLPFVGELVPKSWMKVDTAISTLKRQSLTLSEAYREILKVMGSGSSSVELAMLNEEDIYDALEFWAQLGRVFLQNGQLFPKPQFMVDLIRPLVHHMPMSMLTDMERLGLLKEQSSQPGTLHDEVRRHLQVLEARNEVHEDFLMKHVRSWSQLSKEQAQVMLRFFVDCALLSETENQLGTYLVTARLRNLPSVQQLVTSEIDSSTVAHPAVLPDSTELSTEMRERLEISAYREDVMRGIKESLQPFMQSSHCAKPVLALILGISYISDHDVSPGFCVRANEAFFLLPIRHIAVISRLQARIVQMKPRDISMNMQMFSDGVMISRGKSLCAAVERSWIPNERSPKLRDRVVHLNCVLHLVSNDYGMFRFMSRCIESIIETAFAGLRYECWCPVRDQHGTTIDWMKFDGGSTHAIEHSLSTTLEEKNIFDVLFDGQQLHQLFALCCPVFVSHAWGDGTFLFVKRLKRYIETLALASVWCDYLHLNQKQGALEVKFREGLCKASVILVCLTPRYLTRPNCLRELQWALDFAYKAEKDVRILPLHPALTFAGIQNISQHGCVCVANADGTHKVHRLSAKAIELVVKIKQYMCLNWSDLEPWASDALGESWPEQVLAADGSVCASMITSHSGRPIGLVNELVKDISDKLGFNDLPSKVGDCKELEDKDLVANDVADADVPAQLLDSYPELSPAFTQRVRDFSDRNKRIADAIGHNRSQLSVLAAGAVVGTSTLSLSPHGGSAAVNTTSQTLNIQGIYVKSKSYSFPALSTKKR